MNQLRKRALRLTAVAVSAAAVLIALPVTAASAAPGDANSSAFGVSATNVLGLATIAPTPTSTFPPGGKNSSLPVSLGSLGSVGVLNATTTGDSSAGTSSATGEAADVALLAATGGLPSAISADAVQATCTDNGTAAPTGATTLTNAKLGGNTVIDATPAANTSLVNVPGVATVILNEQSTTNGVLTVNAIHIRLANGTLGDVIIGQATCGPNTPVLGTPIFTSTFFVGLGGVAVLLLGAYVVTQRRRSVRFA